jgi:methionyl aminopeptidase
VSVVKKKEEIAVLREGGKRLFKVLKLLKRLAKPGISTLELNNAALKFIREYGDIPSFLNYQPDFARRPFPSAICVSVNDEIVHGIPTEHSLILKDGDIVSFDVGVTHQGLITDAAITVGVGNIDEEAEKLIRIAEQALFVGIKAARREHTVGDIGHAIEQFVRPYGYSIPKELGGHFVGHAVHEGPDIPNYGKPGGGMVLKEGMVLALEPMLLLGSEEIVLDKDGYTYRTKDGKRSAHFEHTIVITSGEAEILTKE